MDEINAMKLAIAEAYKGATAVSPNPLVGCVVLDQSGQVIGQGYHEYYGGPHAEVNAIKNLTVEKLKGAHVLVTLEPCAHEGKTPSCAKMLAKLPLAKVTYGLIDPNPLVSGQGAKILESAGIKTELFLHKYPEYQSELEKVCEVFLWNQRQKKPFISLKLATSLDGQIALQNGESKWITSEKSREQSHYLRACHDAVLVGAKTVKLDNPSLNIRHPHIQKENKVVVLDTGGNLLSHYSELNIAKEHRPENVYWCVGEGASVDKISGGPQILKIKLSPNGGLDFNFLLESLWQQKIQSLLIEGGAAVASSFLQSSLVNRLYLFQAPLIIGSGGGISWTSGFKISTMKDRLQLKNVERFIFGEDQLITGLL